MIDLTLSKAKSSRYKHAARYLAECGGLAGQIESFGELENHETYAAQLRNEHARKNGFWS